MNQQNLENDDWTIVTETDKRTAGINFKPWARFFARKIDLIIFLCIVWVLLDLLFPDYSSSNPALQILLVSLMSYPLWVFIETLFLSTWGTTLGKYIFNIWVTDLNDCKLNFYAALHRSLSVWIKGLALGIPLISLFTMVKSYGEVRMFGVTSWDKNKYVVKHTKMGIVRLIIAIMAIVAVIVLQLYDHYLIRLGKY